MVIDPNTVGSIEITKSQSSVRGIKAAYGVIAVFTKSGLANQPKPPEINLLKIPGYAGTDRFKSPDYLDPNTDKAVADYRATLYWNPSVKIGRFKGTEQVSFFGSDLTGTYRITVEGVDSNGKPLRSVRFVEVKE